MVKISRPRRTRGMAQAVEYLPSMYTALDSNPSMGKGANDCEKHTLTPTA
jgi:hypothetical protein